MKSLYLPVLIALIALSCPDTAYGFLSGALDKGAKSEKAENTVDLPEYHGVKHALAVIDFDNESGWSGQWALGENLALMLESSLYESGRFIIVERAELETVLMEQDLQSSGRAAKASETAQTGLVRSAKYLATGAVTQVNYNTQGDAGGISFKGIRVGAGSNKAELELVVKLIDSTTSQVVASQRIHGTAGGTKLNVGVYRGGVGGNLSSFAKTPIGEAAQDAIAKAVEFIALEMEDYDITANIVMAASEDRIVINRGTNYGVESGNVFLVREKGEILTDPATGEVLDVFEGAVTSTIQITKVSEKVAYGKLIDGVIPNRGDEVVFKK